MAAGKKAFRQTRKAQTRAKTKGQITLSDPAANNALLSTQLRSLGLYAANTVGDGNCLFRALSDQLYGTPNHHLQLRSEICDWIALHKARYEPFVEDDRGIEVHLRNMRTRGTYGGHLELSAFAHLKRRNVKVIQPGLVYVIEWDCGESKSPSRESKRSSWKGKSKESDTEEEDTWPVYIAYHDWEHFSSIRSLRGPHQGIPHVEEAPQPDSLSHLSKPLPPLSPSHRKAPASLPPSSTEDTTVRPPATLPPSPPPSSDGSSRLTSASAVSLPAPDDTTLTALAPIIRVPLAYEIKHEPSPKRSLEESEGNDHLQPTPYRDKKARSSAYLDIDSEPLSALSSLRSTPALETSSHTSSPAPETLTKAHVPSLSTPALPTKAKVPTRERPLTRRQRKALGLPKPRPLTPGKIVIPGGKHPKRQGKGWVIVSEDEGDSSNNEVRSNEKEWIRNGTGRLDVRGFRELRI